jgi:MoaA/NifB/PqqE/SkfB family radical SAM enzyme
MPKAEEPQSVDDHTRYLHARQLIEGNMLSEAVELLSSLVTGNTELFEPYFDLATIAADQGDNDTAVEVLLLGLERRPESVEGRRLLAKLYGDERRYEEALAVLGPVFRGGEPTAEDYNLVRELLGRGPMLSPTAWIRLVQDLKTLAPRQRQALAEADRIATQNNALDLENLRLRSMLDIIMQVDTSGDGVRQAQEKIIADYVNELTKRDAAAISEVDLPPNFCILPWTHLDIHAGGDVHLCCQGPALRDVNDTPLNVHQHSLKAIWNSADMRLVRSAMLAGVRVTGCSTCWQVEDRGGLSRRQEMNAAVSADRIRDIRNQAASTFYACNDLPEDYQLTMGNACNLKCRSCSPRSSSKIASDPIGQAWEKRIDASRSNPVDNEVVIKVEEPANAPRRRSLQRAWYDDKDFLFGELLANPGQLRNLHVIGGEPLAVKMFQPMLEYLREHGSPGNTTIGITTNGTLLNEKLIEAMQPFRQISVSLSFDGLGPRFEYLRYPGKWVDFLHNLEQYKRMKVELSAIPTFQIYNALDFADLLWFCEEHQLRPILNPLRTPSFLAASTLPPTARQVARERLQAYCEKTHHPHNRRIAESLISELGIPGDTFDSRLFREFMLYTNDLDASRKNNSFPDLYKELLDLIAQDGVHWTNETQFALKPHAMDS